MCHGDGGADTPVMHGAVLVDPKVDAPQRLRHGGKHHLHGDLGRSDVVLEQPLARHAQRAVAVEPDGKGGLRVGLGSGQAKGILPIA